MPVTKFNGSGVLATLRTYCGIREVSTSGVNDFTLLLLRNLWEMSHWISRHGQGSIWADKAGPVATAHVPLDVCRGSYDS